jgi:hypothetical protein
MAQNRLVEALRRAKEEEEDVFLASLSKEELERAGFDTSTFGSFQFVNIYLLYAEDEDEYMLKYIFDADPRQFYYERVKDVGGIENFMNDVEKYLALGGGE